MILDFPATYAKVGAALLRTGKFDATKLFVGGGQPATIPSTVPKDSMEGARGTRPAVPLGAPLTNRSTRCTRHSRATRSGSRST